ncbi:hypothetical protein MJO28_010232 [Puccinia striiformis f. sp. tritici]|uniref:Uncharacterized protein n=3 Tax=Puccinia striiformis TaxID=27350 RepID=A0A0L0VTG3_9BASI|nr:hypothetical protein Pst134EB_019945 [Puccinia striiformis f. sp. tritici]KAI7944537.1 hypothetical protein MJO28_010232 [Puccinia striiformis f. sp. tritici]KAI9625424.1 hypothetical protein KEM48_010904 [Puccinia striiformis f. sp. tritici PST-130]KNF02487.1 hypothetical protein PSTG_04392 [Puccinia striiformis f. sp. tritici PST-78]POW23021.1 hypothetical protein PSHT_00627 [Puccinia striiformis]
MLNDFLDGDFKTQKHKAILDFLLLNASALIVFARQVRLPGSGAGGAAGGTGESPQAAGSKLILTSCKYISVGLFNCLHNFFVRLPTGSSKDSRIKRNSFATLQRTEGLLPTPPEAESLLATPSAS